MNRNKLFDYTIDELDNDSSDEEDIEGKPQEESNFSDSVDFTLSETMNKDFTLTETIDKDFTLSETINSEELQESPTLNQTYFLNNNSL